MTALVSSLSQRSVAETASQPALLPHWVECNDCGLMQTLPEPRPRYRRVCRRCRASFGHGFNRRDTALALAVTALVLFMLANTFPLMGIDLAGRGQTVRLGSGVIGLARAGDDLAPLALFVLAISIVAPLCRVAALGYVLTHLRGPGRPRHLASVLRFADLMRPWAMLDVFLVGALISLTKLHDLAQINIGIGLWALGLLVIALASFDMTADRRLLWDLIGPPYRSAEPPPPTTWLGCRECGLVQEMAPRCTRCRSPLHRRKPNSLSRTIAYVMTGAVLYVPANLYPVLTVISFGRGAPSTIMGGVKELLSGSDWPLGVIVFAASIAVPLLKLCGLGWLVVATLLSNNRRRLVDRTRLYRLIELVSRWSTIDIFVAALLTALVTLGNLATVEPGLGVLAFGGVVLITMMATESFDPRLMWDSAGANRLRTANV
jgi:paraquat-inducible protein A